MIKDEEIQVIISGRVQGVGFRWATQKEAARLGLGGWVRNRPDGTVEVLAQGSQSALAKLLHWLESGPPTSEVSEVRELRREPLENGEAGFEIRK